MEQLKDKLPLSKPVQSSGGGGGRIQREPGPSGYRVQGGRTGRNCRRGVCRCRQDAKTNWDDTLRQDIPQDADCHIQGHWLFTEKFKKNIFKPVDRFSLSRDHTSHSVEKRRANVLTII